MNIVFLSVLLVVFVSLLMVIVSSPAEYTASKSCLEDKTLIKMSITPSYVGGLQTVLENTRCKLLLLKDKLIVKITFKGVDLAIPFDKIKDIALKDRHGLNEDTSISKLFSTRSMYIPKQSGTNEENEFIVITYINSKDEEQKLILHYNSGEEFIKNFEEAFNLWKCGDSVCDISEHAISLNLT